ncbi:MAG: shikimate dehydrogenase [Gammaproteobacteria bacterium]|nr:shikimate dehydrogenase [Gammaproteobacteria bacterium]
MDHYAVFGNPIAHSKSPLIHSLFAQQTQQAMDYQSILTPIGGFSQAAKAFFQQGGKGANVTVPFKFDAYDLVQQYSHRAQTARAVNTIKLLENGEFFGDNTDGAGLVRDIKENHNLQLKDKTVLVLGAGGAVSGIIQPLLEEAPQSILIANRTVEKAQNLLNRFDSSIIDACGFNDERLTTSFDIVINGTAASLHGENVAVPSKSIKNAFCYDMMYGAEPTTFMLWANTNGAKQCCDGLGMLVEQAAEAFFIWRHVRPETQSVIQQLRSQL